MASSPVRPSSLGSEVRATPVTVGAVCASAAVAPRSSRPATRTVAAARPGRAGPRARARSRVRTGAEEQSGGEVDPPPLIQSMERPDGHDEGARRALRSSAAGGLARTHAPARPRPCPAEPSPDRTIYQPPRGHRRQPASASPATVPGKAHRHPHCSCSRQLDSSASRVRGLLRLTGTPPDVEFTDGNHGRAGLAADRLHLGEVSRPDDHGSAALNRALPRGHALLLRAQAGSPGVRQHHGAAGPRPGSWRRGTRSPLTAPVRTVHARARPVLRTTRKLATPRRAGVPATARPSPKGT